MKLSSLGVGKVLSPRPTRYVREWSRCTVDYYVAE